MFLFKQVRDAFAGAINDAAKETEALELKKAQERLAGGYNSSSYEGTTAPPPRKRQRRENNTDNIGTTSRGLGGGKGLGLTPPGARGRDSMYSPGLEGGAGGGKARRQSTVTFQGDSDLMRHADGLGHRTGSLTSDQLASTSRLPPRRGGHQNSSNSGGGGVNWAQTPKKPQCMGFDPVPQHPDAAIRYEVNHAGMKPSYVGSGVPNSSLGRVGGGGGGGGRRGVPQVDDPNYAFGTPSTSLERMQNRNQGGGGGSSSMGALCGRSGAALPPSAWELPLPSYNNKSSSFGGGGGGGTLGGMSSDVGGLGGGASASNLLHPSQRGKVLGFGGNRSPQTSPGKDVGAGLRPMQNHHHRVNTFTLDENASPTTRVVGAKSQREGQEESDLEDSLADLKPPTRHATQAAAGGLGGAYRQDTDQLTLRAGSLSLPPEGGAGDDGAAVGSNDKQTTFVFSDQPTSRLSTFVLEGDGVAAEYRAGAVAHGPPNPCGSTAAASPVLPYCAPTTNSRIAVNNKKPRFQQQQRRHHQQHEGRSYCPNDYREAYGNDPELLQKLHAGRMEDQMYAELLELVVVDSVQTIVTQEVEKEFKVGFGATFGLLRDTLAKIVTKLCPKSTGVLKCAAIKGGKYALPVDFDAADKEALADLPSGNQDSTLVIIGGAIEINKRQLRTLDGTSWLADPVINGYCKLIEEMLPGEKIHCLSSFFYSKAAKAGYSGTARWTRKIDLFSFNKVLVVINEGKHWTLAVINFKRKRFEYYDSLGGKGTRVLETLRDYLDQEYVARKLGGKAMPNGAEYSDDWGMFQPGKIGIPQQNNGVDCGVFTTQFALYCAQDSGHFNFGQAGIPYLRKMIQLELIGKKLLPRL